ncbi:MAG: DUF1624 domain-containing protein [Myxococcales bacterium]|nr:DUF1624 domain-containing protein [Myxococcales bacterium]
MKTSRASQRLDYIDGLRGLAVVGMFLAHTPAAWGNAQVTSGIYAQIISWFSGLVAPVFMTLAGVSMAFVAKKAAHRPASAFRTRLLWRGLSLVLIGYAFEASFWVFSGMRGDPMRIFKVNILPGIGASMLLLAPLLHARRPFFLRSLAAAVFLVLGAQITWRLSPPTGVPAALWGYLAKGDTSLFPLFPYAGWVAFGMALGDRWPSLDAPTPAQERFTRRLLRVAALLFVLALGLKGLVVLFRLDQIGLSPGQLPPATTVQMFALKMGITLLLLAGARRLSESFSRHRFGLRPLVWMGRTSLFAYIVHLWIIHWVARAGLREKLGIPAHLLSVLLLGVAMVALCYFWDRHPSRSWWPRLKRVRLLRFSPRSEME